MHVVNNYEMLSTSNLVNVFMSCSSAQTEKNGKNPRVMDRRTYAHFCASDQYLISYKMLLTQHVIKLLCRPSAASLY
jgi:hypothetical protein